MTIQPSTHLEEKANGWIFLSHSSDDYQDVRIIRNYLEDRGFSAIMFYLKCYNPQRKDSDMDKVQKIIKCEINKRNIFVLCDSANARKSKFVQKEISIVKQKKNTIFVELDLDNFKNKKDDELEKLDIFIKKATLFFSYSNIDESKVNPIKEYLHDEDFQILDASTIDIGQPIEATIREQIRIASEKGAVLLFLNKNSFNSQNFWDEKGFALNNNALIIPILLDKISIEQFPALVDLDTIDASDGFRKKEKEKLINLIK